MKKAIFSIIAILVMVASVSAQTDKEMKQAAVVKQATDQFAAKLQSIGMHGTTEVSMPAAGQFQVTKPAVVPAKSSKPASSTSGTAQKTSGQRQLQASKVDTLPNGDIIGPNFAVIGGVTYLSDGNGGWVIPGGGQVKQNQPPPVPTANPGNSTGMGVTVVSPQPKLDDMYDVLPDGRVISAGPVRVEPAAGGGSSPAAGVGNGTVGGLPEGFTQLPNGVVIQKEKVNGVETRIAWFPDGTYAHLDANADLAKITLNGKDFFSSGGEVEAGGPRNSYKHGMRDAAGHTGKYYRRGAGGAILSTVGNVLGVSLGSSGTMLVDVNRNVNINSNSGVNCGLGPRNGDMWYHQNFGVHNPFMNQ
jgi:hypothetical protein